MRVTLAMESVAQRRAVGRVRNAAGGRVQRAQRNSRGCDGGELRHPGRDIAAALRTFRSVKRRLEVKAETARRHHHRRLRPSSHSDQRDAEGAANTISGRRLWAVLEPRSNTLRRKVFETELAESLAIADQVVLAGVFKSDAIPEAERLDPRSRNCEPECQRNSSTSPATADDIVTAIAPELREGDVVAILSNGGFGGIYEKLPAKLNALHEASTPA